MWLSQFSKSNIARFPIPDDFYSRMISLNMATERQIVMSLLLTDRETEILNGFLRVWNRRRQERAVRQSLLIERMEDQLAKHGQLGATVETRKKLRADVILKMKRRGDLEAPEVLAAEEIRDVWVALERAMFPTRSLEQAYGRIEGGRSFASAIERLSPEMHRKWHRYRRWAQALRPAEVQITLDVVKDNHGVWQVEQRYGLNPGKRGSPVTELIQATLRAYAIAMGARSGR